MIDGTGRPDYNSQIDKACRVYAELGFSTLRVATQLIRSGYPPELVQARYPDLPASDLPQPPSSRALDRARKSGVHTPVAMRDLVASIVVPVRKEPALQTAAHDARP